MAYSELIKNFDRIRSYMREFYVCGFKVRKEIGEKSARTYDDERRRIESWLGDYMCFRQMSSGKNVFLSFSSQMCHHNPLYTAWKTKSFTDGDITLHFIIFDLLHSHNTELSLKQIMDGIADCIQSFDEPHMPDESTVRKKLREYIKEGIILSEKRGRVTYYRRSGFNPELRTDVLDYFSEVSPCGVIGSYLLDRECVHDNHFAFKHHYITNTFDSEVVCMLFEAMHEKRYVTLKTFSRRKGGSAENCAVPLRIMISVQSGRQYLMAYFPAYKKISPVRTDSIVSVKVDGVCQGFDGYRRKLDEMLPYMWGVSMGKNSGNCTEHVEFTVKYADDEPFIPRRLEREKRCGSVVYPDGNTAVFSADVYDACELVPWIRTFTGRIVSVNFSDKELERQFNEDLHQMYDMYGIEGGESL